MEIMSNVDPNCVSQSSQQQVVIHTFSNLLSLIQSDKNLRNMEIQNNQSHIQNQKEQLQKSTLEESNQVTSNILVESKDNKNNQIPIQEKCQNLNRKNIKNREIIFTSVYQERKIQNIEKLKVYSNTRMFYYNNFIEILHKLFQNLQHKAQKNLKFFQQFIQYFTSVSQIYKIFYKSFDKMPKLSYANQSNIQKITNLQQGFYQIIKFKDAKLQSLRKASDWIDKFLLKQLKILIKDFMEPFQAYLPQIDKLKNKYQYLKNRYQQKLNRIFKYKDYQNQKYKIDILQQQLQLINFYQQSAQKVFEWSQIISKLLSYVWYSQSTLFSKFKQYIIKFFSQIKYFTYFPEMIQAKIYWQQLEINQQLVFKKLIVNILTEDQIDYIKNHQKIEKIGLTQLKEFLNMNTQQICVEKLNDIIKGSFIKSFKALSNEKNQNKEQLTIYSSINQNLIFYSESYNKIKNRMSIKELKNKRTSLTTISVSERQKRFLGQNWNKQMLFFGSINQTEQFLYLIQSDEQLKQQYLN